MTSATRDQGLKRISRMTRWIGVAGIAGAGVFAAVVAKATPGRTTVITPAVTPAVDGSAAATSPLTEVSPSGDQGLQAPAQAPRVSRRSAAAVSGGS